MLGCSKDNPTQTQQTTKKVEFIVEVEKPVTVCTFNNKPNGQLVVTDFGFFGRNYERSVQYRRTENFDANGSIEFAVLGVDARFYTDIPGRMQAQIFVDGILEAERLYETGRLGMPDTLSIILRVKL